MPTAARPTLGVMNSRDFNASVVIPNLAVLVLVAIGLFSDQPPLTSHRPPAINSSLPDLADVPARLWQDPFSVRAPELEPEDPEKPDGPPLIDRGKLTASYAEAAAHKITGWRERVTELQSGPDAGGADRSLASAAPPPLRVLVMPVLLSGKNYAEDHETRLRTRYAVLSALGRAQYVPVHANAMQFAAVGLDEPHAVPFEEFEVRYLVADQVRLMHHENDSHALPVDVRPGPALASEAEKGTLVISAPYDRVVVAWLDETKALRGSQSGPFGTAAVTLDRNVAALLDALIGPLNDEVDKPRTLPFKYDVKVIGPTNTNDLVAMLEPVPAGTKPVGLAKLQPPPGERMVFSPRASAAEAVVQISLSRKRFYPQAPLVELPQAAGWRLRRTIATDDHLVDALLRELRHRRATPNEKQHLVLIGEWDTIYSRGIARTFAAKLRESSGAGAYADRSSWAENPAYLHEISYLRGIDGQLETGAGTAKASGNNESDDAGDGKPAKSARAPERSSGQSQLDYLRRIEAQLRHLNASLAAAEPKAEIRAIGVIGSDTYDKMLVLRALRGSFPRATFFTTDADAIYLDPSEGAFTANLLVAAPFGLTAHPDLQHRIPPFRDSYQTGLFLTVLQALGLERIGGDHFILTNDHIQARVFEVGRTGFRDLSPPSENPQPGIAELHPVPPKSADSPRRAGLKFGLAAVLLAIAFLWAWLSEPLSGGEFKQVLFGLFWVMVTIGLNTYAIHRAEGELPVALLITLGLVIPFFFITEWLHGPPLAPERVKESAMRWACIALFVALAFYAFSSLSAAVRAIQAEPCEEPFAWFEGVSIWPTEIVRLGVIVVSVIGVAIAQRRLDEMKCELTRKFGLGTPTATETSGWQGPRRFRQLWLAESVSGQANAREKDWWRSYCAITTPELRFYRIALCMSAYLAVFIILGAIGHQPIVPVRGEWSYALDKSVLIAAVLAYCYLLFFVLDVTIMAASLIEKLTASIGIESTDLKDGAAIRLINDLTDVVAKLVYLPFTALFMMIVSRNKLFDHWDWPPLLLGVFGSGLVLIFFAALLLQQRARAAQQKKLDDLDDKLLREAQDPRPDSAATPRGPAWLPQRQAPVSKSNEQLWRELRAHITSFDGVAFQRWHHNPLFRALLIPLGGLGSLQLLEKLGEVL